MEFVEEPMIKALPSRFQRTFEEPKVHDHPGLRIWSAPNHHLGSVRMAMDSAAWLCVDHAFQRVRSVESKFLAEFEHQGIPRTLCDCRESRQRGLARQ